MKNIYDFDTPLVRRGSGCVKWDQLPTELESGNADDILPFWVADMDFRTAPAIVEAIQRRAAHGAFGYTHVTDSYYDAVISWFERRHQWTVKREWIQYTQGVVPALSVVVKAFTEPGDQVVVQTPVYNCFFSSVRNNGCELVTSALKLTRDSLHYEMDFDDLEAKVSNPRAKLFILCNPHNPACRVWTHEELLRVHNICKKHGVVVVADEIHNELTYHGKRYVPYGVVSQMDNAVVCASPSKSFNTAGLQVANIFCANAEWRQRIDRAININEVCDVNPFGVVAVQAAYNEGEEWLDQLCDYIYKNYEALCDYIAKEMPRLRVTPLEGTYLAWIDITALGITSEELTKKLLNEGRVWVNSGTMYGPVDGEGFIRVNMACPRAQLMEGLRRIKQVVDKCN